MNASSPYEAHVLRQPGGGVLTLSATVSARDFSSEDFALISVASFLFRLQSGGRLFRVLYHRTKSEDTDHQVLLYACRVKCLRRLPSSWRQRQVREISWRSLPYWDRGRGQGLMKLGFAVNTSQKVQFGILVDIAREAKIIPYVSFQTDALGSAVVSRVDIYKLLPVKTSKSGVCCRTLSVFNRTLVVSDLFTDGGLILFRATCSEVSVAFVVVALGDPDRLDAPSDFYE
jgi:hypothetical protein